MPNIFLNEFWSQRLAELPESGMGYQRIDFTLKDHRVIRDVIVLNGEECQTNEDFDVADVVDVQVHRPKS